MPPKCQPANLPLTPPAAAPRWPACWYRWRPTACFAAHPPCRADGGAGELQRCQGYFGGLVVSCRPGIVWAQCAWGAHRCLVAASPSRRPPADPCCCPSSLYAGQPECLPRGHADDGRGRHHLVPPLLRRALCCEWHCDCQQDAQGGQRCRAAGNAGSAAPSMAVCKLDVRP